MTFKKTDPNTLVPARQETGAKGLVSGALWNVAGLSAVLASNLLVIPIVIKAVGPAGFGEAVFVLALCSPLMLIGTILSQAVASLGAVQVSRAEDEQFYRILASTFVICTIAVLAISAVLVTLTLLIPGPHRATTGPLWHMMIVAILALGLRQFGLIFQATMAARKDYRRISIFVIATAAIEFFSVLLATMLSPSVFGYLIALAVSSAASLCCWLFAAGAGVRRIFSVSFGSLLPNVRRPATELATLLSFARWQGSSAVSGIVVNQSNPLLIGFLAPPLVLAHFNVAARLEQAISAVFIKFAEVLLPHFGYMKDDTPERLGHHFLASSFVISVLGSLLMGPMISLSTAVMSLWIGQEFATAGGFQLRFLATGGLINMAGAVFTLFALGTGRVELAARIVVEYALVTVASSITVIVLLGAHYAGLGLVLGSIFSVGRRWQVGRQFLVGHSQGTSAMLTLWPVTVAIVISYFTVFLEVPMPRSWFGLFWHYGASSTAIFAVIMITVFFTNEGRKVQLQIFSIGKALLKIK